MKKFLIVLLASIILMSCSSDKPEVSTIVSKFDVPRVERIGYNEDYNSFIYSFELDGHKYILYRETILMIE